MPPGLAAATATQETETGQEDSGAQPPTPPPSTSGSRQLLSQQRPHYQTGQDWGWEAAGGFPQHCLWSLFAFASTQAQP